MSEEPDDPIADDEVLYRRIPASMGWFTPPSELNSSAFSPDKSRDITGISISRNKYNTPEDVARRGGEGRFYYIAVFLAGDLRRAGIRVVPRPTFSDPGHAEIPDMNVENRKEQQTLERRRVLAEELCLEVIGPFLGKGMK